MESTQKVQLITGSTTSVALVNKDGTGRVVKLQNAVNRKAEILATLAAQQALLDAITALDLELPDAE